MNQKNLCIHKQNKKKLKIFFYKKKNKRLKTQVFLCSHQHENKRLQKKDEHFVNHFNTVYANKC